MRISILEFLIQYRNPPTATRLQFGLLSPARLGPVEEGSRNGLLAKWQRYLADPALEPSFLVDLRNQLKKATGSAKASRELKEAGLREIGVITDAELADFVYRVHWAGRHADSDVLRAALAQRIEKERAGDAPLPGSTCVHILLTALLERASNRDTRMRVLNRSFVAETLAAAMPLMHLWREDELRKAAMIQTAVLPRLDSLHADIRTIANKQDEDRRTLALIMHAVTGGGASRATLDELPLGSDLGQSPLRTTEIAGAISDGRYQDAIIRCQRLMPLADARSRRVLRYLEACAYSGTDMAKAAAVARLAAGEARGTGWDLLLDALAARWAHDVPSRQALEEMESTTTDLALRNATRLMLAEIAYAENDGEAMWKCVAGLSEDRRAVKLRVRALIEQGKFDSARTYINGEFREDDPEGLRLHADLAMKEIVAKLRNCREVRLPDGFTDSCEAVILLQRRAMAACAEEAHYRRHELMNNCGVLNMWARHFDEAIRLFRCSIEICKEFPQPRYNLAHVLFLTGRTTEALAEAKAALAEAGNPSQSEVAASTRLLIAVLSMQGAVQVAEVAEARAMCVQVVSAKNIPAKMRSRARIIQIEMALRARDSQAAEAFIAAWPAAEQDQYYQLAHIRLLEELRKDNEVLAAALALDEETTTDGDVRHHARLAASCALANLGRVSEAAAKACSALSEDYRWHGLDLALELLARQDATKALEDLENQILAGDPANAIALRSRVRRFMQGHKLAEAAEVAVRLAKATAELEDIYRAAVLFWTLGRRANAADILLPAANRLKELPHMLLAAILADDAGDQIRALELAVAAFEQHGGANDAASIVIKASLAVEDRSSLPMGLDARVSEVYRRLLGQPGGNAVLQPMAVEQLVERVRSQHVHRLSLMHAYETEAWPTFLYSMYTGRSHAETIFEVLTLSWLHVHVGPVRLIGERFMTEVTQHVTRFVLDLPSLILAVHSGIIPLLRKKWRIGVTSRQVMDLQGYQHRLRDDLRLADQGKLSHFTIDGQVKGNPEAIRRLLGNVEQVIRAVEKEVEVFQPAPIGNAEDSEQHDGMQDVLELMGHARDTKHDCVVLATGLVPELPYQLRLSTLVSLCAHIPGSDRHEHCRVVVKFLRLGVRRLGVSFAMLRAAYELDEGKVGENLNLVINHFREGQWIRQRLVDLIGVYLYEHVAGSAAPIMPDSVVEYAIASILHGRSFDRKSRRKAIGILHRRLQKRDVTKLSEHHRKGAVTLLSRIRALAEKQDPCLGQASMISRHNLRGHKPGL